MKDLEERKKKKNKQKDTTGGNSALDVPYPDGVRKRSKIHTYQIKTDDLDEDKNLLDTGLHFLFLFLTSRLCTTRPSNQRPMKDKIRKKTG